MSAGRRLSLASSAFELMQRPKGGRPRPEHVRHEDDVGRPRRSGTRSRSARRPRGRPGPTRGGRRRPRAAPGASCGTRPPAPGARAGSRRCRAGSAPPLGWLRAANICLLRVTGRSAAIEAASGPNRALVFSSDRTVRFDVSVRCIESLSADVRHHDRPRHPRAPQGAGPPRLRAAQAARRAARRPLGGRLVRIAVSGAHPARARRPGQGGRGQHPHRPARPVEWLPRRRARRVPRPPPVRAPAAAARRSTASPPRARPASSTLLTDPQPCDDRTFAAAGRVLPASSSSDERLALFERRRAELLARAADRRRAAAGTERVLDRYRRTLRERDDEALTDDLAWLDRLIAGERRPSNGGSPLMTDRPIRLAIAGVGNCASSLLQGLEFYKDADPAERVPGLMHVELGGYHIRDIELVAAFDVDADKVGLDVEQGDLRGPQQHDQVQRRAPPRRRPCCAARPSTASASSTAQICEESPLEPVDVTQVLRDTRGRRARVVPPGRLRAGAEALRAGLPRRRRRVRQRHPGVHRLRPRVGGEVRGRRRADRR